MEEYFEFANILLTNLVDCGVEFVFDTTRLLISSAKHSEESYHMCCNFVQRAEVLGKIPLPPLSEGTWNILELQCEQLRGDMLKHVTDDQLQEYMLKNLELQFMYGTRVISVGEFIAIVLTEGRIADIRRLHRLGFDIEYLHRHLKSVDASNLRGGFIQALEYAEEQGWFENDIEYLTNVMCQLLKNHGAFDAVKWLYVRYLDTHVTLWHAFKKHTRPPHSTPDSQGYFSTTLRRKNKNYKRGIRWVLEQNRYIWQNAVEESFVIDSIRNCNYQLVRALYTFASVKPRKEHAQAALRLAIKGSEHEKNTSHVMFLMLRCIRDALRANGFQLNLYEFVRTAGSGIDSAAIVWMVNRGFFAKF